MKSFRTTGVVWTSTKQLHKAAGEMLLKHATPFVAVQNFRLRLFAQAMRPLAWCVAWAQDTVLRAEEVDLILAPVSSVLADPRHFAREAPLLSDETAASVAALERILRLAPGPPPLPAYPCSDLFDLERRACEDAAAERDGGSWVHADSGKFVS